MISRDGLISREEMISAMHRLPSPGADPVSLELMEHVCSVCETYQDTKMVVTKESFERAFTEHFECETKRMITAAGVTGSRVCVVPHSGLLTIFALWLAYLTVAVR